MKTMWQQTKLLLLFSGLSIFWMACEHQPLVLKPSGSGGTDTSTGGVKCSPDTVYFANDIQPFLRSNCGDSGCHGSNNPKDGFSFDVYTSLMSSGRIKAGDPAESDLFQVLNETDPAKQMPPPPASPLNAGQIEMIRKWIAQGARNNRCNEGCDSTLFTYSASISKIISTHCAACHSSGNVLLNNYAAVKARVDDGRLWGALKHLSGYQPMPNATTFLSACDLNKIQKWIAAGAPDN